ncbi:MAG TPA: ion transporter [Cellvibrionaceae bacterium]|nr:ion transporter [Cellvibrionaceae bacterium]
MAARLVAVLEARPFRLLIGALIIISMVSFSFDTVPDLNPRIRQLLDYLEYCSIGVFTLEYGARVATAPNKLKFIFSFYGLIDLIAILPFTSC